MTIVKKPVPAEAGTGLVRRAMQPVTDCGLLRVDYLTATVPLLTLTEIGLL